jgi:hypothetical protein
VVHQTVEVTRTVPQTVEVTREIERVVIVTPTPSPGQTALPVTETPLPPTVAPAASVGSYDNVLLVKGGGWLDGFKH